MVRHCLISFILLVISQNVLANTNSGIRIKDLARIEGEREFALVGYGLVVGLSGSGDSLRNKVTLQSLSNTLRNFGLTVTDSEISSRNAAAVIVTAELPAYSEPGDRVDITAAALGDARSLSGGTLLLTPLYGPDQKLYALGQGSVVVGGYKIESFDNLTQKNHSTVGQITSGGILEQASPYSVNFTNEINIILKEADYTTADRLVNSIYNQLDVNAEALHPGKINVQVPENISSMMFMAKLENVLVNPDVDARVIVNERTGSIVAGGNVTLGNVSISHGNLHIEIDTDYFVSQPNSSIRSPSSIETVVVPDTTISVTEDLSQTVGIKKGSTVADLVQALNKINLTTRDVISILQSIKAAGALHAQLIIQ